MKIKKWMIMPGYFAVAFAAMPLDVWRFVVLMAAVFWIDMLSWGEQFQKRLNRQ